MSAPLRIILGAAVALVVIVVAILPPILHFFTGPSAPAIGGFLAGKQLKLSDKEATAMGVLLAVAAGVPAYIFMSDLIDSQSFAIVAAAVASLWCGGLATVAAWFAGPESEEEIAGEST